MFLCVFRLISEFGYGTCKLGISATLLHIHDCVWGGTIVVWVNMAVISAFVNPTIWLLSEHPKVLQLFDWAGRKVADTKATLGCIDQPQGKASDAQMIYERTLARAMGVQTELTGIMLNTLLSVVFGMLVSHCHIIIMRALSLAVADKLTFGRQRSHTSLSFRWLPCACIFVPFIGRRCMGTQT